MGFVFIPKMWLRPRKQDRVREGKMPEERETGVSSAGRGGPLPFAGMVMVVFAHVGNMAVSKAAMSRGMSDFILVVYANALATLLLLPAFVFFHRSASSPINFSFISRVFGLGLIGCLGQISGYAGIQLSSPTLGTAILNLIPAFTFILAIAWRMENLDWRSSSSQAKLVGTVVSIAGALIVTFYKGSPILLGPLDSALPPRFSSPHSSWIFGGFLLAVDSLMISLWYIVQASIIKKYPSVLIITFFYCCFVTILSAVISLIAERDPIAWRLRTDMGLFSVLFSAIIGILFRVGMSTWCLRRTGPLYVSMFKPLGIGIAVIMDVIFLGQTFHLGSLLGIIVIVGGFYAVMWGKAKEEKTDKSIRAEGFVSSTANAPLLHKVEEV